MDEATSLRTTREGRIGRVLLNRPRALNALDLEMIRGIATALEAWRELPEVHAILIEGAGGRAFCAGGDIRAVREAALAEDSIAVETFFADEYALNEAIARYPKPYIALIDGVCMGGGIGLSVHGTCRIASEHALFAMPETAIGLFPDIGASYFLPRLPGELGMYLALTGAHVQGADAVHAGFATHFVPRAQHADLIAALLRDGPAVLAGFAAPLAPFGLAAHRAIIDACFSAPSVGEIFARLAGQRDDFADTTLARLKTRSPSSLLWSFKLLRRGGMRELNACLGQELALTRRVTRHPDFLEGVRAMLIDKDRSPRWSAADIHAVDEAAIDALFG